MKRNILIAGAAEKLAELGEVGPFKTEQQPAEATLCLPTPAKPTQVIPRMILRLPSVLEIPGEGVAAREISVGNRLEVDAAY